MNSKEIAQTIVQQLGGNQFCMMVGVKTPLICLAANQDRLGGVSIGFKARAAKGIKSVRIELTPMDTYKVSFYGRAPHFKEVFTKDNVYCDELQSLFEEVTGLCTYLFAPVRFG